MATLRYWTGTSWEIVPTGTGSGGGGGGIQGPPGADGISIQVSGPQPNAPANPRKGDQWLTETVARFDGDDLVPVEEVAVRLLPDPPLTVFVSYLP